jgi:tetratricopeptide (TPR) repeat protein
MKKLLFIFFLAVAFAFSARAQQWVNFSSSEPKAPEINLITSTPQTVTFEVIISGIYTQDTVVNGTVFKRLTLPGGEAVNPVGSPEIPVLNYRVAIPECDGAVITCQVVSRQTMPACWVYPVPEIVWEQNPDGYDTHLEQFTFNASAYTQPRSTEPVSTISSSGAFRDQQYVEVTLNPIEFCPVTQQLAVITQIVVTLTFTYPHGDLLQDMGIFNDVASSAFINFDMGGEKGIQLPPPDPHAYPIPSIRFINLTDTAQACKIVCDYLIITVPEFYSHPQLLRLAEHRRKLNGYDIAIVNVEQILGLNFFYEGNSNPNGDPDEYIKEQKMRTFIRRVYEGKNALHMVDKRLAYVLLLGDCYEGNTGMPTSKDHEYYVKQSEGKFAADYYFSCITKDAAGKYDIDGDLCIGRFSVENDGHLYNMVQKTIYHESEYNPKSWRKTAGFTYGSFHFDYATSYHIDKLKKYPIFKKSWKNKIVNWYDIDGEIRGPTIDYMNEGASFVQYWGHGAIKKWENSLHIDTFRVRLNNEYMAPFINTNSCQTGWFDYLPNTVECLAEFLTRYDSFKGAVGYIGATRTALGSPNQVDDLFVKYLLNSSNMGSIAGNLMLKWKLATVGVVKKNNYNFVLFGDPALDILAEGFEVTRDVTAEIPAEIKGTVLVHKGATLTIPDNGSLKFFGNGKLIIEEESSLVIGNNVQIIGINNNATDVIHVIGGGFSVGENVVFQNLSGGILLENIFTAQGIPYYDETITHTFENVTFIHTPFTHSGSKLNLWNCTFNQGSDVKTSSSASYVNSCTFNQSTFTSDQTFTPIQLLKALTAVTYCQFIGNYSKPAIQLLNSKTFFIHDNTISGAITGVSLTGSGCSVSEFFHPSIASIISENNIFFCGTGIELFNSIANISGNNVSFNQFGVRLFNNSNTTFGNKKPVLPIQNIKDNYSFELFASSNSFPAVFRYNQIIDEVNLGNTYNDPLVYWDIVVNPGDDMKMKDVNYNSWGQNFDKQEDLYPPQLFLCDTIWDELIIVTPFRCVDETLFQTGLDYFTDEDYPNAETTFKELIENHPESLFSIAAMHELFSVEQFLDNDFNKLNSYYTSLASSDSTLFETAEFLATRCNVKERNWQPAINWYEERIENPPSYQDSVFAVIDLGDIHLMMEGDTIGGTRGKSVCHYHLAEIKPQSKKKYEENKATLLATLPQVKKSQISYPISQTYKKGSLVQCIPNPVTKGSAIISYEVYTEGSIEIKIYNSLGQFVRSFPQGTLVQGNYQAKVSFAGTPAGLYHYTLLINGEKTDAKKLVVSD